MVFLILLCLLLFAWAAVATFFLFRFVRIIMILEDDLSDAVEVLQDSEKSFTDLLDMQMYFDSPEVQRLVANALESVKASKVAVAGLVRKFTQRSKHKYVQVQVVETAPTFFEE